MRALPLTLLLLAPASALASPPPERLEAANRLYEASLFTEAADSYRELLAQSPHSAALHYNLGNAYFRQGTPGALGKAIASYFRAFRLDPRDGDIRANLDFALRRSGEELAPAGMPPAVFLLYNLLSARELAALFWLAFWAACLSGSAAFLAARARAAVRPVAFAAAAGAVFFGAWWALRLSSGFKAPAVVTLQDAEVRSGPGENFPVNFKVPEGRRVERLDEKGPWFEIGVPREGLKGWILKTSVEPVG
ncbi:MAG: tetratricopeptide repeat protein [Elusimicrobia bacterium]|nr:tetratricopeptide repeat protein [Elusimicrobiota bacterium]